MWPNPQIPADSVTYTREILNGKLHFLCSGKTKKQFKIQVIQMFRLQANGPWKVLLCNFQHFYFPYMYISFVNNFMKKTSSCWDKLSNVCSFSMSQICLIREPLTLKKYRLEYLAKLGSCFSYTLNAFLRLNVLLFSDGRMFLKTWILSFHLWLHKHFSWIHFWVELVSRGCILQHLNNHILKKCYECLWESFLESFKNY